MKRLMICLIIIMILTMIGGRAVAVTFGDGGVKLQNALNNITLSPIPGVSSTNVVTDALPDDLDSSWLIHRSVVSVITMIKEAKGWADFYTFGIYDAADPTKRVQIFDGVAASGSQALLSILGDGSVMVNFVDSGIDFSGNTIGYYLDSTVGHPTWAGGVWYSDTSLNADGMDHMTVYQGKDIDNIQILPYAPSLWNTYEHIFAFEDLHSKHWGDGNGINDGHPEYSDTEPNFNDFVVMVESVIPSSQDKDGDGYKIIDGDCDDADPNTYPEAIEICDGKDNNCDGTVPVTEIDNDGDGLSECQGDCDDSVKSCTDDCTSLKYEDFDGDSFGNPAISHRACDAPSGYVDNNTDCDDNDKDINPGKDEILFNGIDDDCDPNTLDRPWEILVNPIKGLITTEAGGKDTFTVKLTASPSEKIGDIVIKLESLDRGEGTVSPLQITFNHDNWEKPQTSTIKGKDDNIPDGNKRNYIRLTLLANVPAIPADIVLGDIEFLNKDNDSEKSEIKMEPSRMNMISIVHWPENPSVEGVFGEDVRLDYEDYYKIGTYFPEIRDYIEPGRGLSEIVPGRAYWCYAHNGLSISFDGIPVTFDDNYEIELFYNPDTMDGWNMIACPINTLYIWEDVEVVEYDANGDVIFGPVSIGDLKLDPGPDNGYIYKLLLWKFNGNTYVYYDPAGSYENTKYNADPYPFLVPKMGYWVKGMKDNLFLRFPKSQDKQHLHPKPLLSDRGRSVSNGDSPKFDDSPPMPLGGFISDEGGGYTPVDDVGCFIRDLISGFSPWRPQRDDRSGI